MFRQGILFLFFLAMMPFCGHCDEFRAFTAGDGRVIEARIVEYNSARRKLRIERRNGKSVWVEPKIFSETDRNYILDWIRASDFLSNSRVRMSIERHKKAQGKSGDDIHFSVQIQNRTDTDFEDLVFEYRFFIKGNARKSRDNEDRVEKGRLKLDRLAAGERKTIETNPHRMKKVYDEYEISSTDQYGGFSTYTVEEKIWDDDDQGIWFKISGPVLEGKPVVREEWYPKELNKKVAWVDNPVKVATLVSTSGSKVVIKEAEKYLRGDGVEKDVQKALQMLTKEYEERPSGEVAAKIGGVYLRTNALRDYAKAGQWMARAAEHGSCYGYNTMSMFFSSNARPELRNGELAVKYGELAVEMGGESDWLLDTLACAYARNGQFALAVRTQEDAYKKARKQGNWSKEKLEKFKLRLELFNQGKTWPEE